VIPWVECDCCDDYICNIHYEHVYDCVCPPIDYWVGYDAFPYEDVKESVIKKIMEIKWDE